MPERQYRTLSKRIVDRLAVNGKDAVFWDSELPGFGIRVYSTGRKVYVVQTRMNGKSRRVTVGRHGDISPDEARKDAAKYLARMKAGLPPVEAEPDAEPTVADLAERYQREYVAMHCKPNTIKHSGISVLAIPRWSGYSDPRLGCKVFVFLSRSMLRSLPFGSLNAARSPRSSSLEGFSPTRLRVVPSSATQRLFSVAAVARYPPGTGSAQIRPSISANSLRLRCPSANSSQ